MIRTVWLAPDVVRSLTNRDATLSVCRNSVTQYMIHFSKHCHGSLPNLNKFDHDVCAVVLEAIAGDNPHLRNLLNATVNRNALSPYGDVVIRFNVNTGTLIESNPGARRLH